MNKKYFSILALLLLCSTSYDASCMEYPYATRSHQATYQANLQDTYDRTVTSINLLVQLANRGNPLHGYTAIRFTGIWILENPYYTQEQKDNIETLWATLQEARTNYLLHATGEALIHETPPSTEFISDVKSIINDVSSEAGLDDEAAPDQQPERRQAPVPRQGDVDMTSAPQPPASHPEDIHQVPQPEHLSIWQRVRNNLRFLHVVTDVIKKANSIVQAFQTSGTKAHFAFAALRYTIEAALVVTGVGIVPALIDIGIHILTKILQSYTAPESRLNFVLSIADLFVSIIAVAGLNVMSLLYPIIAALVTNTFFIIFPTGPVHDLLNWIMFSLQLFGIYQQINYIADNRADLYLHLRSINIKAEIGQLETNLSTQLARLREQFSSTGAWLIDQLNALLVSKKSAVPVLACADGEIPTWDDQEMPSCTLSTCAGRSEDALRHCTDRVLLAQKLQATQAIEDRHNAELRTLKEQIETLKEQIRKSEEQKPVEPKRTEPSLIPDTQKPAEPKAAQEHNGTNPRQPERKGPIETFLDPHRKCQQERSWFQPWTWKIAPWNWGCEDEDSGASAVSSQ